jgi:hypothetical protein
MLLCSGRVTAYTFNYDNCPKVNLTVSSAAARTNRSLWQWHWMRNHHNLEHHHHPSPPGTYTIVHIFKPGLTAALYLILRMVSFATIFLVCSTLTRSMLRQSPRRRGRRLLPQPKDRGEGTTRLRRFVAYTLWVLLVLNSQAHRRIGKKVSRRNRSAYLT